MENNNHNPTQNIDSNKSPEKNKTKISRTESIANFFREKSSSFLIFICNHFEVVRKEIEIIKLKSKNLLETNYNLGLKHLEKGNLGDATFRFKFIKKFWPHHYESHYQLAYCYFLQNRFARSKKILEELIIIDPTIKDKALQLIAQIEHKQAIFNNNDK